MRNRRDFIKQCGLALSALAVSRAYGADALGASPGSLSALGVIPRTDWTDVPIRLNRLYKAGLFNRLTVHHTGSGTNLNTDRGLVERDLDGILGGHLGRGYGDIGYHFILDYAGRIWEGRSLAYRGAHVSSANPSNIGVMLLGNFQEQRPSSEQTDALARLATALQSRYGMNKSQVFGHCDLGQSVCPGRFLYPYVAKLRT